MENVPFIAGLVAAVIHVLSGPDHLAAVTPMALEEKHKTWSVGLFWGLGHLSGMLVIGGLFYFFKDYIPLEWISGKSEQLVGVILIGIGVYALIKSYKRRKIKKPIPQPYQPIYSYGIGVIHGFAGIAHFVLLFPVLGFETKIESGFYIIGFALGTILAMVLYSLFLGNLSKLLTTTNSPNFEKVIKISGALFAIIVGIYWMAFSI